MPEIPFWLIFSYGLIETTSILTFICVLSGIKIDNMKLIMAAVLKLLLVIGFRNIFPDAALISIFAVITNIFFIWLFFRVIDNKVVIYSILSIIIVMAVSPVAISVGIKFIYSVNFFIIWVLTGMPHIIVLMTATLIHIKFIRNKRKRINEGT